MKIGIMGAHGTGKTTLAKRQAKNLEDTGIRTTVVTGAARACPWPINRDATEEAQRWIYHRHMLMELEAVEKYEAVFCDRTALDSIVYSLVTGLMPVVHDFFGPAVRWLRTYDELHWMRPKDGWLVDDGKRDVDPGFQLEVDRVFDWWISLFKIPVVEVSTDWE